MPPKQSRVITPVIALATFVMIGIGDSVSVYLACYQDFSVSRVLNSIRLFRVMALCT
jgi:hypothetical protein